MTRHSAATTQIQLCQSITLYVCIATQRTTVKF
jgi:hypothetical protein